MHLALIPSLCFACTSYCTQLDVSFTCEVTFLATFGPLDIGWSPNFEKKNNHLLYIDLKVYGNQLLAIFFKTSSEVFSLCVTLDINMSNKILCFIYYWIAV